MTQPDPRDVTIDACRTIPRATYRLQFSKTFGFKAAAALAPYLARLGISHVYASPCLKARPGSTHGYDIVSHDELNPELGSTADFKAMVQAFKAHGLGQILDFVPNHMGVGGADNPWWLDLLEWGPHSEFAGWFDIDWRSDHQYLRDKVLAPLLGDHYGVVLEAGELKLRFDADEGGFAVWAYDVHKLPICPSHYGIVLGDDDPELERLGDRFANLGARWPETMNQARNLKAELARRCRQDPKVRAALDRATARFNGEPGVFETWSRLESLIANQHWRPAYFRAAADDINYRRFFNVNDLAGIRMEIPELFDHAHRLVMRLLGDGDIDGIRLDHIDGLLDPKSYCLRLRDKTPRPFYLVVEKILAAHEHLRESWRVDGTTGYEFASLVTGLLIDSDGEEPLTSCYSSFTGRDEPFERLVIRCKLQIMDNELASELNVLARAAGRIARSNPRTADFTDNILRRGLREVIACLPVYRTYVDEDGARPEDRRELDWAFARARRSAADIDPGVFGFLHLLMTGDLIAAPRSGFSRMAVLNLIMRVQQYSGPVMAKGVEDTAFYRYNRLLALNEVGGQPQKFGLSIAAFHQANAERARRTPFAMLSTSTHDTKRGEDARARLAVLSEVADDWTRHVGLWRRILRAGAIEPQETPPLPDSNDEYAFYQMLLGSWPPALCAAAIPDADAVDGFRCRIEAAMTKALREARLHTNWGSPNVEYEDAMLAFIRRALDVSRKNPFLDSFLPFAERICRLGWHNSMVQLALKMTVPGVPDVYQGAELWELSMVDPDNRRPVDFDARIGALAAARTLADLSRDWRDGGLKLWLTHQLLKLRAAEPDIFRTGSYRPLEVTGADAARVCAFARCAPGGAIIVAVSLYPGRGAADHSNAQVIGLPGGDRWRDVLTGRNICGTSAGAAELFGGFPVAILQNPASVPPHPMEPNGDAPV